MSARFGRNQRRKLREAIAAADRRTDYWIEREASTGRMLRGEIERQGKRFEEEIKAARVARNTIRITVDSLLDERDRTLGLRARLDMLDREALYSADRVDYTTWARASEIERGTFIKHAGEIIAEHALAQILRHWRSR